MIGMVVVCCVVACRGVSWRVVACRGVSWRVVVVATSAIGAGEVVGARGEETSRGRDQGGCAVRVMAPAHATRICTIWATFGQCRTIQIGKILNPKPLLRLSQFRFAQKHHSAQLESCWSLAHLWPYLLYRE